jgi:putative N-acetylmannosamine-6-phosphate epimerase
MLAFEPTNQKNDKKTTIFPSVENAEQKKKTPCTVLATGKLSQREKIKQEPSAGSAAVDCAGSALCAHRVVCVVHID